LSAIEKRDVEQLARLRTVHEQNILKLTSQVRQREIDAATETVHALEKQQEEIGNRKTHYQNLRATGLLPKERTEQTEKTKAIAAHKEATTATLVGALLHLIPQLGAPTAMKYGGVELGGFADGVGRLQGSIASRSEAEAGAAGVAASFERRDEEWKFQQAQAEDEEKRIGKELAAAKLREEIAIKSRAVHDKSIEQAEEIFDFYGDKFSGLGLYTWLSTTLQRLYRDAYNCAYAMARLTEQAYRFERADDGYLLGADYWDSSKAGLLAGDKLLVELENLERRFIETNYRTLEIEQTFSVGQMNPAALVQLRESGSCQFAIPEIFFDLAYPGHYRRRIRAIRLTIPCVTGPYTNVGATLALVESQFRNEPKVGPTFLKRIPPTRTVSIATSKAQNDAGVFEFNFRDERYMPFEGAGAISSWKLSLPGSFRPFDYQTISDVMLHVSYTAEEDGLLREKLEKTTAAVESEILKYLKAKPVPRLFSLRHEFPTEFHRLLHSPAGTEVDVEFSDKHFPLLLQGHGITVDTAKLALRTADGQAVGSFKLSINGSDRASFPSDADLGGLPANNNLTTFFGAGKKTQLKFSIKTAGALNPTPPVPGDPSVLSSDKLLDMLIYLEYRVKN